MVVSTIDLTPLIQKIRRQRDFLKWMSRRYSEVNPAQAAAFRTGAEFLDEMREELKAGVYDVVDERRPKELFTEEHGPARQLELFLQAVLEEGTPEQQAEALWVQENLHHSND